MDKVILSSLDLSQLHNFIEFNQKSYPKRKNIEKHFKWQFLENPLLENKEKPNVLLCKKKDKIVGQFLFNPIEWYCLGKSYRSNWGVDNYVLEEHRGISGALMALKLIRGEIPYFGTGPSEIAKKMFLPAGLKTVGDMQRFFWFRNPLAPLIIAKHLLFRNSPLKANQKVRDDCFPPELFLNGYKFKLIKDLDNWEDHHWNDTLEFSRSREFLKWRFFNSFKKYHFYLADNSDDLQKPIYFVVRKYFWKGVSLLFVVDYKIPQGGVLGWRSILKASKSLAKINHCDGILTMSSHKFFDKELRKKLFFKVGKENLIITNTQLDVSDKIIQDRNLIYATMADSDLEFAFW
jgi:hypothetical protein